MFAINFFCLEVFKLIRESLNCTSLWNNNLLYSDSILKQKMLWWLMWCLKLINRASFFSSQRCLKSWVWLSMTLTSPTHTPGTPTSSPREAQGAAHRRPAARQRRKSHSKRDLNSHANLEIYDSLTCTDSQHFL